MPSRRRSLGSWSSSGPLLALSASCLCGCPQLLSDQFGVLGSTPDPNRLDTSVVDAGSETGGASGEQGAGGGGSTGTGGSAGSTPVTNGPPDPLNDPDAGGVGGAGGAPVSQPGAPTVVSVSPSNGAIGVAADAVITVTFSEPMNPDTVQAAYGSSDLPSVSFNWSSGNTVLQITPNQPLTLATGTNPAATTALSYAFQIGSGAVDLQGSALPSFSSSFSTLRAIDTTLPAVQDRTLTGNWRSDNVYGDNSCVQVGSTTTCIGDSSNGNSTYKGFVTFDLSTLPAQTQAFSSAVLGMSIDNLRGSPFPALGTLVAEHVSFDSISLAAFNSAALGLPLVISSSGSVGSSLSVDLLTSVQNDLAAHAYSQFRFRFTTATNSDGSGDLIEVKWATEQLAITYLIP